MPVVRLFYKVNFFYTSITLESLLRDFKGHYRSHKVTISLMINKNLILLQIVNSSIIMKPLAYVHINYWDPFFE